MTNLLTLADKVESLTAALRARHSIQEGEG